MHRETILHISELATLNRSDISELDSLFAQTQFDAIVVAGVSARGENGYLKAGFVLCQLMEKLHVPAEYVLALPSSRDMTQLQAFSEAFFLPALKRPFNATPHVLNLNRLQLISCHAIPAGKSTGVEEGQLLDWQGLAPLLCAEGVSTRLLATNLPMANWTLFPRVGMAEWLRSYRVFELSTETRTPPNPKIRQFVTEQGSLQALSFEPETGFFLSKTYHRQLGGWALEGPVQNPRQWEQHFRSIRADLSYPATKIALLIARRTGQLEERKKLQSVLNAVIQLQNRVMAAYPDMSCIGENGANIKADSLDLAGEKATPAILGWRWIETLKTFPKWVPHD